MGISQKTENIYSKVMPELFEHQNECIGNHPEVANSQIDNCKNNLETPDFFLCGSGLGTNNLSFKICEFATSG